MKIKFFLLYLLISVKTIAQVPHELLITEVMADPTPSRGLAEKEYVEVYNASAKAIQLKNYTLQYSSFKASLPEFSIEPGAYVILLRKGNEANFADFGKVLTLQQLSLNNSGSLLRILKGASVIHEISYSDTWYAKGKAAGYALEMIDLNFPCLEGSNWTSSAAERGGTPGFKNASSRTNPDITPPQILFFDAAIPAQISLFSSEKLDTIASLKVSNYSLSAPVNVKKVTVTPDGKKILIDLSNRIPDNLLTDLIVRDLTDCSGNVASDIKLTVGNLLPADSGSIVFNEVLFNPKLGGGDYIELYNRSSKPVSLKNWMFASLNLDGTLRKELISPFNLIIEPADYLVFTEDKLFLSAFFSRFEEKRTVTVPKLPPMRNNNGSIFMLNEAGKVFDRFDYDEKLHHPIIDNPDGVALEKISVEKASNATENWQSAAAEVQYGTPGYRNSQREFDDSSGEMVWVEPEIFTPDMDGLSDVVELKFALKKNGNVATVHVVSVAGVTVKTLVQNALIGNTTSFSWDGTDQSGNELPVGYYIFIADIFNPDGTSERFKRKVVLGRAN